MRLIILNRKRLGVTIIIVGLMLILFGFEKKFDGRLKYVALIQNNINSLKKYEVTELRFSYKLPDKWTTQKEDFGGGEIVYHNNFSSDDSVIYGFVQVWNMREELKSFLGKSKDLSDKYATYKDYKLTPITVKGYEGYQLTYTMSISDEGVYKGYEYFLKDKGKLYRFSFFVREVNYKETMATIFKTIVDTMEVSE